jgi:4-hydroxy-tetrahydrodipicolinate synthase
MLFGRLLTAMCTPFTPSGEIDWDAQAKLIEHLLDTGTDTIVVVGTTAESPTLSKTEKLDLLTFTIKQVAGRGKVIAGVGSNNTAESVAFTRQATKTGVDGVMAVVPYYNKPSQQGMIEHFTAIAKATHLPVMLYNVPGRTVANMTAATMVQLANTLDNVVAIKEASGDLTQITEVIVGVPEDVAVYSGDDALTLPVLAAGGAGVVSVASHIVGKQMKDMIDAYFAGNVKTAAKLHQTYLPVFTGLFSTPSPTALKYVLAKKGFIQETVRLPLVELNETEKQQVDEWYYQLVN